MPKKEFPPVAAFGVAIVVALLFGWLAIGVSESDATLPHVPITGTLTEATIVGGRKSPALHLRMQEQASLSFRLDPGLFSKTLHKHVPDDLRPGARISVLVLPEQNAHPSTPPLGDGARIVWFRGLTIGDREVFGLAQAREWEVENQRSFYLLLALSLLAVLYYGVKWFRTR